MHLNGKYPAISYYQKKNQVAYSGKKCFSFLQKTHLYQHRSYFSKLYTKSYFGIANNFLHQCRLIWNIFLLTFWSLYSHKYVFVGGVKTWMMLSIAKRKKKWRTRSEEWVEFVTITHHIQRRLTADWITLWESVCLQEYSKIFSR